MVLLIKVLDDLLKLWHPRGSQVTVHEKYPPSNTGSVIDKLFCLWSLTSSKGDSLKFLGHVLFLSEPHEIGNWVRSSRQNEDQWNRDRGVLERLSEVERWGLNEWVAQVLHNEVLHGEGDLIRSQGFKDNDLLEGVQLVVPCAWDWLIVRFFAVEYLSEFCLLVNEELLESLKYWELSSSIDLLVDFSPFEISEPVGWVWWDLDVS